MKLHELDSVVRDDVPVRNVRGRIARGATRVLVVALVLATIGIASAELYLRNRIEGCLATDLRDDLGSSVDVDLGPRPVVLSLIDRRLPELTVDSDDAQFGPAVGMTVHATLRQVSMGEGGGSASVGGSEARVDWDVDAIGRTLHGLAGDVRTSAVDGTVDVTGVVGVVSVRLRPYVEGGIVRVEIVSSRGVSPQLAAEIADLLSRSLGGYPLGLRPESVTVTDSGIGVELRGGSSELPGRGDTC
ncbi:LmeA family phospholipid-binding protein [Nocardia cyriacigeorgica]|uniref:LmeA family phospholipid-binding protein n=1 Tax=Nocardia cyriacigeorgica TaxID=135487 RepID=UPI003D7A12A6